MFKQYSQRVISAVLTLAMVLSVTLFAFPVSAAEAPELGPVTSKDVVYQIITDRFYDGDPSNNVSEGFDSTLYDGTGDDLKLYQGGDWAGIIDKIPYLKGMGVTAVWISAPYENRDTEIRDYKADGSYDRWTSFHGYHVRNYFATNKHFGTLNEFKELRDALHANGIKLIIDFVTNHTSREMNPTAGNTPEDGKLYEPDRKEDGSFAFDENGEPYDYNGDGLVENLIADPQNDTQGWFHGLGDRGNDSSRFGYRYKDLGSLADFSQENGMVAGYLEDATLFWANMGVNGIRHDATLHLNPAFVKGLKDAVDSNSTVTHFGEFFIGRPDPKYDETVVLLSKGEIDSKKVRVEFSLEDMDMSGFQKGATYEQIKAYVLEHTGLKVSSLYISQIKRKCGLDVGQNYNLSKKEDAKVPKCPPEKEAAIRDALKYFQMI